MKIIIVDEKHGSTRSLVMRGWARAALTVCLLGLPIALGYFGHQLAAARNADLFSDKTAQAMADQLQQQDEEIAEARQQASIQLRALTRRIAGLQARLLRLDALGERLTNVADLDDGEFDFSRVPAQGGPEMMEQLSGRSPDFIKTLDDLARRIEDRRQQLEILENLLTDRKARSNSVLAGWPVSSGWISSPYGRRIDPFTGNLAWHQGMDIATGSEGVEVTAIGTGVVSYVGERQGYGLLVEINHGNGYKTLYAHDDKVMVEPGDLVKKGQVIALSGSSGRSTGPHLHIEVHKNGRVVDPASYIRRTNR